MSVTVIPAGTTASLRHQYDLMQSLSHRYVLEKGACLELTYLVSVTGTHTLDLEFDLVGVGAQVRCGGTLFLNKGAQLTLSTRQYHRAPRTKSNCMMRALLAEGALLKHPGLIRVEEKGVGTQADLESKQILLAETARAITEPSLEVLTDDVQCAHGSASGPIDTQLLFYAQSRGMGKGAAEQLLLNAFLLDIYVHHSNASQKWVHERVAQRSGEFLM